MTKNKIATLIAGMALTVGAAGCNTEPAVTNTNANMAANVNANRAATTSNTAVVVNNNNNSNTSGVSTMNTNSRTYATREEFNSDRDRYINEAKGAGYTIGSGAEDGWIHFKTKSALATTNDLRDSTINVDVDNNVVTLKGSVASAAQKAAAEKAAKAIDGVKSVRNQLVVKAAGSVDDDDDNLNKNTNTPGSTNRNANRKT